MIRLALAAALLAQVVPVDVRPGSAGPLLGPTAAATPSVVDGIRRGCGVRVGVDRVLTVAHVVGGPESSIAVSGRPACVVDRRGEVVVLRVAGLPASIPAARCTLGTPRLVRAGDELIHRWYDRGAGVERVATVREGARFRQGESGSGLWSGGELVGVVERTDGMYWRLR